MAEEVRFHIEQYAADLRRAGVPDREARRRARLEFGSVDNVKDDCREARGLRVFDDLGRDLRHALRLLRRTPGFTASAVATIALCLGANLAIFAVVDSILLRPLPFPDAERLVRVFNTLPESGRDGRRRDGDELLRAARPDSRAGVAGDLPRRHRRGRRAPAPRSGWATMRVSTGVLLDARRGAGDGARVLGRRDDARRRPRCHRDGRVLAPAAERRPGRGRPDDSRRTACR